MVVDHDTLRLGVYPTEGGMVALMFQLPSAKEPEVLTLCTDEIALLCKQLEHAQDFAQRQREANAEKAAAQAAFDLLSRVKEAAK